MRKAVLFKGTVFFFSSFSGVGEKARAIIDAS